MSNPEDKKNLRETVATRLEQLKASMISMVEKTGPKEDVYPSTIAWEKDGGMQISMVDPVFMQTHEKQKTLALMFGANIIVHELQMFVFVSPVWMKAAVTPDELAELRKKGSIDDDPKKKEALMAQVGMWTADNVNGFMLLALIERDAEGKPHIVEWQTSEGLEHARGNFVEIVMGALIAVHQHETGEMDDMTWKMAKLAAQVTLGGHFKDMGDATKEPMDVIQKRMHDAFKQSRERREKGGDNE